MDLHHRGTGGTPSGTSLLKTILKPKTRMDNPIREISFSQSQFCPFKTQRHNSISMVKKR